MLTCGQWQDMRLQALAVTLWFGGVLGMETVENSWDRSYCLLEPEVGVCRAAFPRWFYNHTAEECQRFTYGGCQGNENNFEIKEECKRKCSDNLIAEKHTPRHICFLEASVGRCRGAFPRWHFNKTTRRCEIFIYGGCKGGDNQFVTQSACEQFCEEFITDPCSQPIITASRKPCDHQKEGLRFGYNRKTKKCESFYYSSCKENKNNFKTRKQCLETCARNSPCLLKTQYHRWRTYPSYFYDANEGKCRETFTYFFKSKMWPQENRFRTRQECIKECKPQHTSLLI
ncbi:carboxypeptidase inhibitor SmCI-like [Rhipicephalus sanguineus]|uniref:carboxypeptidase inhibitor SmCI-like n=1 Tax=Rhipicephalus sanguineus TaxID=34632 RepID=UPI0018960B70|nr:carboxypeptidase inhibitor SmCI-like [Rhipicephalus sanguineus]